MTSSEPVRKEMFWDLLPLYECEEGPLVSYCTKLSGLTHTVERPAVGGEWVWW